MKWIPLVLASLWVSVAGAESMEHGRITVIGEAGVESAPDMATITLGVTSRAKSAGAALDETSKATGEVLAALEQAGIAARDVQTRDLDLSPIWDNSTSFSQEGGIEGYRASNTVVVKVRALNGLGQILDAVVDQGANTFSGLRFGLQDPGPAQDAARRAAVAEAMRKATLYAEAAGLVLGPVLEMSETGSSAPAPMMMEQMVIGEGVPVAQGEVSVRSSVTMVFAVSAP